MFAPLLCLLVQASWESHLLPSKLVTSAMSPKVEDPKLPDGSGGPGIHAVEAKVVFCLPDQH